jgi:hypothetical protein
VKASGSDCIRTLMLILSYFDGFPFLAAKLRIVERKTKEFIRFFCRDEKSWQAREKKWAKMQISYKLIVLLYPTY